MKVNYWFFLLEEGEIHPKIVMKRDILSSARKLVQSSSPFWICRATSFFIFPGVWLVPRKLLLVEQPRAEFCHPSICPDAV